MQIPDIKESQGYTLLESLIVLSIVVILSGMSMSAYMYCLNHVKQALELL